MFLPHLIEKDLLHRDLPTNTEFPPGQRLNTVDCGVGSRLDFRDSHAITAMYCKVGKFSKVSYHEGYRTLAAYPILGIQGGDFCDIAVYIGKEFTYAHRDPQTGTLETLSNMHDHPVIGIVGDSFKLNFECTSMDFWGMRECYSKAGPLSFFVDGKLLATLKPGVSLLSFYKGGLKDFIESLVQNVYEANRRTLEEVPVERIPA